MRLEWGLKRATSWTGGGKRWGGNRLGLWAAGDKSGMLKRGLRLGVFIKGEWYSGFSGFGFIVIRDLGFGYSGFLYFMSGPQYLYQCRLSSS